VNSFLSESVHAARGGEDALHGLKRPTAAACFMMMVASPDQKEHMSRSPCLRMAAMWGVKSVTPSWEELEDELHVRDVALQHSLVGLPAIMAIGVVVTDAGHV